MKGGALILDYALHPERFFAIKNKVKDLYDLLDEVLYFLLTLNNTEKGLTFKEALAIFGINDVVEKINGLDFDKHIESLNIFLQVIRSGT